MTDKRSRILEELVKRSRPLRDIKSELSSFSAFDTDPIVTVFADDIARTLSEFIDGGVSKDDVQEWADMIEVRDDLGYESGKTEVSKQVIYELANPLLAGPLTLSKANDLLSDLRRQSDASQ